jgi:hypothetical protein
LDNKIGEVTLLNDYLSTRLQIRCEEESAESESKSKKSSPAANENQSGDTMANLKHVNMIYCRLIDINLFTQILIESSIIKKLDNSKAENTSEVSFVLPNVLKEFYTI